MGQSSFIWSLVWILSKMANVAKIENVQMSQSSFIWSLVWILSKMAYVAKIENS